MDRREACSLSHGQQQLTDRAGGECRRGRGKSWVVPIAGGVGPIGGLSRGGPFGRKRARGQEGKRARGEGVR